MKYLRQFSMLFCILLVGCTDNESKEDQYFDLVTDFEYDYLISHNDKHFQVWMDDKGSYKRNMINNKGAVLLKNWYYEIMPFANNSDVLFVRPAQENKMFALMNMEEQHITDFAFTYPYSMETFPSTQMVEDGKYGSIDSTGKVIIDFLYDRPFSFQNNQAKVVLNGRYKVINEQNIIIDENPFPFSQPKGLKQFSFYSFDGVKYGILNRNDEIICEPKFKVETYSTFNDFGYAVVKLENGSGIIDTTGTLILTTDYIMNDVFENKLAMIVDDKNGTEYQLINFKGDICFNDKFDNYFSNLCTKDNLLIVSKNKKFGLIDLEGNVIVDFDYTNIKELDDNYFAVGKDNKYGLAKMKSNLKPLYKLTKIEATQ